MLPGGPAGPFSLLRQTWDRYHIPVAVTEVHLGCTREEQLRWVWDVWQAACRARSTGADIRAVTAWSAFGACDWDSLVTRDRGHYEPGLFDVRTAPPRRTALASLFQQLARGETPDHPVLSTPGWWHRPQRLFGVAPTAIRPSSRGVRPLLVLGGNSALGRTFSRLCRLRGLPVVLRSRRELDPADRPALEAAVAALKPWAIINAGGYVGVDAAESEPETCRRENTEAATVIAEVCGEKRARLLTFSTDLVFDGRAGRAYQEGDAVSPLNVYGATKAEAESRVIAACSNALVVRAGAMFGTPSGSRDFVRTVLAAIAAGKMFPATDDLTITPCYLPDLVNASLDLLIDDEAGVCHVASPEPVTWAELARTAARLAGLDEGLVEGRPVASFGWPAPRPPYTPLASGRGSELPQLSDCLQRFMRDGNISPAA